MRSRLVAPALLWGVGALLCAASLSSRADSALHSLWQVRGRHNTVYLLGSIHVLRPSDYPLAPAVLDAYASATALLMEINLAEIDGAQVQAEMLAAAMLPEGTTLPQILGAARYARAGDLAHAVGVELSTFDRFAPWFAAEAISQLQLSALGFQAQSGVDMYFLDRARGDGKRIAGLETVHDQIALFASLSMDQQAEYLLSSLNEARELPQQATELVGAWQRGDTAWFEHQLLSDLGQDPVLYQSLLLARNRNWIPKIEALLNGDKNYLVIVGTAHLVGRNGVIDLLKRDGIGATQR